MTTERKTEARDQFKFYDHGWNARVRGEPFTSNATRDWKDGWRDCNDAKPEDREEI